MRRDYEFVLKSILNKDNNLNHYSALKKMVSLFKSKYHLTEHDNFNYNYLFYSSLRFHLRNNLNLQCNL